VLFVACANKIEGAAQQQVQQISFVSSLCFFFFGGGGGGGGVVLRYEFIIWGLGTCRCV